MVAKTLAWCSDRSAFWFCTYKPVTPLFIFPASHFSHLRNGLMMPTSEDDLNGFI